MESIQEIRREKVFVPVNMNIKEIMKKYGVAETTARNSKKRVGWSRITALIKLSLIAKISTLNFPAL
jgi:uncharacterized protein YjcR